MAGVSLAVGAESEVKCLFLAIAEDSKLDGVTGHVFTNEGRNGTSFADVDAVNFGDDVFVFESGLVARAIFDNRISATTIRNVSATGDRQVVGNGYVWRDIDIIYAHVGTFGGIILDDVIQHAFDARNGDSEANAVGVRASSSVNTDNLSSGVDERTARVTGIDSCISLDHVTEVFGGGVVAGVGSDGTPSARDNARGDGILILTKSVADGDDLLASGDCLGITKGDSGKIVDIIDLEEGNIVERVGPD